MIVLPAEFGLDPTGFGRLSGIAGLSAPAAPSPAETARTDAATFPETAFRSDLVEIRLRSSDLGPAASELEYKVRMKAGDTLVYSWTVEGLDDPEEFYFDFHGETPAGPGNPKPVVIEYRQATGGESHGTLVAPIPGVHGWYLQNQSASTVTIRMRLSGFYELIAPGDYGNEARILARPVGP